MTDLLLVATLVVALMILSGLLAEILRRGK